MRRVDSLMRRADPGRLTWPAKLFNAPTIAAITAAKAQFVAVKAREAKVMRS